MLKTKTRAKYGDDKRKKKPTLINKTLNGTKN